MIYSDINQYRVVMTAGNADSLSPETLLNTYVRNTQGKMIPLSAMAHIKPYIAPVEIEHYNQMESSTISYNLADGITQADGLKFVDQAMFAAQLPPGVSKRFTGDNQKLVEAMENALIVFAAVILVMYIVLGILYESLIHPLTILSTLPAAGMGAFLAMLVTHTQLTMMSVIAVLMLIGIVKKNAILMVDFALVAERERRPHAAGSDSRSRAGAFPPDHHDDAGGHGRGIATGDRFRRRLGDAPAVGYCHPWWLVRVAVADLAQHTGDLFVAARPSRTQGDAQGAARGKASLAGTRKTGSRGRVIVCSFCSSSRRRPGSS